MHNGVLYAGYPSQQIQQVRGMIAFPYNNESMYGLGSYCTYNGKLYKCIIKITTPEDFDSTKWEWVNVCEELVALNDRTMYRKGVYDITGLLLSGYTGSSGSNASFFVPYELADDVTTISISVTGATIYLIDGSMNQTKLNFSSNLGFSRLDDGRGFVIQIPFASGQSATGARPATMRFTSNATMTLS